MAGKHQLIYKVHTRRLHPIQKVQSERDSKLQGSEGGEQSEAALDSNLKKEVEEGRLFLSLSGVQRRVKTSTGW